MKTTLVKTRTMDGIELHGLHYNAEKKDRKVVIHLPGIWGNFYENPFIEYFGKFYPDQGYSFLSVNMRDHDGGAIYARFEDCTLDLNAWLGYLSEAGYKKVLLQGHSLGAIKVVYYQNNNRPKPRLEIGGLILLSPFDNIPFYSGGNNERRQKHLATVQTLADRDPDAIVPRDVWDMWLLSAKTYLELNEDNGNLDVFPFRKGDLLGSMISKIEGNIFAAVGGNDFAAYPSPEKEVEMLSRLPQVKSVLIPEAPHNFAGREEQLLKEIQKWFKQIH